MHVYLDNFLIIFSGGLAIAVSVAILLMLVGLVFKLDELLTDYINKA